MTHNEDYEELKTLVIKMDEKLDRIVETQISQAKDIEHHIARTDALEALVEPLTESRYQVMGMLKLLGSASIILALVGLFKLIKSFF